MSIIYDALRKIEKEKNAKSSPLDLLIQGPPPAAPKRRRRLLVVGILCACAVAVSIGGYLLYHRPHTIPLVGTGSKDTGTLPEDADSRIQQVLLQPKPITLSENSLPPEPGEEPIRENKRSEPAKPGDAQQKNSPAAKEEITLPELQLKGISHSGRKSWAFINQKMLASGDTIEGAEIVEILEDRVKLVYKGIEFTLKN